MKKGSKGKVKSTYDKIMGRDNLFCDSDYDEMQKAESYKICFKLFRAQFWLLLIMGLAAYSVGAVIENFGVQVTGVVIECFAFLIYLIYGALTSSKGIMPASVVKSYAPKRVLPVWVSLSVLYAAFFFSEGFSISMVLWFFFCIYNLIMSLLTIRNEKVLKRQLEE